MTSFRSTASLSSLNEAPLAYWRLTGYTAELVQEYSRSYDDLLAVRIDFGADGGTNVVISKAVERLRQGHLPACLKFIHDTCVAAGSTTLSGPVLILLEDGMWDHKKAKKCPVLCFGRDRADEHAILVPDPAFMDGRGYESELQNIARVSSALPWEQRKATLFWRGAGSGLSHYAENWIEAPRVKVALLSKRLNDRELLDAAITKVVQYPAGGSTEGIPKLGITTEPVSFEHFLNYRYVLDVDGEHCAWRSLFLKLASGSVVFKPRSSFLQWYYDRIKPWIHYIPVASDFSDVPELVKWARSHDEACREICANASALIETLSYANVVKGMADLVQDLLALRR